MPALIGIEENSKDNVQIFLNIPRWENLTSQRWEAWISVKRLAEPGEIHELELISKAKIITTEELPPLPATINISPDTLNLRSRGRWITCFIELPEGYDVADIDMESISLNGVVPAVEWPPKPWLWWLPELWPWWPPSIGDHDHDGIPSLMVKFSRPAVQAIVSTGEVELTLTGLVNSTPFEGSDTIRVIKPGKGNG